MTLREGPVGVRRCARRIVRGDARAPRPAHSLCVGVADDDRLACVAIMRRLLWPGPDARREPIVAEVTRCAIGPHAAASMAIAAATRAAVAHGYLRLVSYTLLSEAGVLSRRRWVIPGLSRASQGGFLAPGARQPGRRQGPVGDRTGRAPGRTARQHGRCALQRSRRDPGATPGPSLLLQLGAINEERHG